MSAGPAPVRPTDALDPLLLVPYGRWRRWVRALRARGGRRRGDGGDGERVVLAYGATLVALTYLPMAWLAVRQAGVSLGSASPGPPGGGPALLVAVGAVLLTAAGLAGLASPRVGLPLWVSEPDARYALAGTWRPRTVLWRRGVLVLGLAAAGGALLGSALAAALLAPPGGPAGGLPAAELVAWALCAAGLALGPVAVGVAAQGPRWRRAAVVAVVVSGAAAVVAGVPAGAQAGAQALPVAPSLAPPAAIVVGAVLVAVVAATLVLAVLPDAVDVDAAAAAGAHARTTGVGLVAGEAAGVRAVPAPGRRGRARTLPPRLLRTSPVLARDVLGLARRPGPLVSSTAAGTVGAAAAAVAHGSALVAVVGALLLYAAATTWTAGLTAMASQTVPGALLPGRPGRQVVAHAVVPTVVALVAVGAGVAVAATSGAAPGWPGAAAVVVAVLGARVGVAGATAAPVALFTPVPGPTGDLSTVAVVAWYLRGWLVVAAVAWATTRSGTGALLLAGVVAGCWGVAAVARLARQ